MLIDGLEWCGLLWCFYQLFGLSFWRHPFTAEDPLVSKWWNDTFLQICFNEETNSSTSWMARGSVNFQPIFLFLGELSLQFWYLNVLLLASEDGELPGQLCKWLQSPGSSQGKAAESLWGRWWFPDHCPSHRSLHQSGRLHQTAVAKNSPPQSPERETDV